MNRCVLVPEFRVRTHVEALPLSRVPVRGPQQVLARSFGCARVMFNEAIAARQAARAAGVKVSDTDV